MKCHNINQIEISDSQHIAKIWKKRSNLLQQDLNTSSKYCNYFINKNLKSVRIINATLGTAGS